MKVQQRLAVLTLQIIAECASECIERNFGAMHSVNDGEKFFPYADDPCMSCICVNSSPQRCQTPMCELPKNCLHVMTLRSGCCKFRCVPHGNGHIHDTTILLGANDTIAKTGGPYMTEKDERQTANLGLRLVASTITSFVVLGLLLFMVHRLRQRRVAQVVRRLNHRSRGGGSSAGTGRNANSMRSFSLEDDDPLGLSQDGYTDLPPPYTPFKPPEVILPPSYEVAIGNEEPPPMTGGQLMTSPPVRQVPENDVSDTSSISSSSSSELSTQRSLSMDSDVSSFHYDDILNTYGFRSAVCNSLPNANSRTQGTAQQPLSDTHINQQAVKTLPYNPRPSYAKDQRRPFSSIDASGREACSLEGVANCSHNQMGHRLDDRNVEASADSKAIRDVVELLQVRLIRSNSICSETGESRTPIPVTETELGKCSPTSPSSPVSNASSNHSSHRNTSPSFRIEVGESPSEEEIATVHMLPAIPPENLSSIRVTKPIMLRTYTVVPPPSPTQVMEHNVLTGIALVEAAQSDNTNHTDLNKSNELPEISQNQKLASNKNDNLHSQLSQEKRLPPAIDLDDETLQQTVV